MKRLAIALLATVAAVATNSARADTRVSIGVNVGAPVYRHTPPTVVYAPAPTVVVAPRGYWKEVVVKTWVPERWVVRHNRWGRSERYCEPGHFAYRTERVWVDSRHDRHDDRRYSYGYNNHNHRGGWNR